MQTEPIIEDPSLVGPGGSGEVDPEEEKRILSKVTKNVIPLVWILSFFSILSRINLVNMHHVISEDLNLSEYQYGCAVGAFYLGFVACPVPAALILERLKMNVWMTILVLFWGIITVSSVFVSDSASLMFCRFCLGVSEAGLSPLILYYITIWFGEKHRIKQICLVQTANPLGYAANSILSGVILNHFDGVLTIKGWQWLYILTGVPPVLLSLYFYFHFPNHPGEARFLTPAERQTLIAARSHAASVWTDTNQNKQNQQYHINNKYKQTTSRGLCLSTVLNPKNWLLYLCGTFMYATVTGVNGFIPTILLEAGAPSKWCGFLTSIPSFISVFFLLFWAHHASKSKERFWHIFVAYFVGLLALGGCIVFVYFENLVLVLSMLSVYQSSVVAGFCVFVAEMVSSLTGSMPVSIAMYYTVIGLGGWGPFMMGYLRDFTGDHVVGLAILCSSLAMAIAFLSVYHITQRYNEDGQGAPMKLQTDTSNSVNTTDGSFKYGPKGEGVDRGAAILL